MKDRSYCLARILRTEEKGKGEDEEAEASDNESVKVESVVFAASNSPNQPEKIMLPNKIQVLNRELTPDKRTKSI
jgi:hypothetical protein